MRDLLSLSSLVPSLPDSPGTVPADVPSDLLTTAEVAALFGVVPDAVRQMARNGALPIAATVGRGRQRLFDRAVMEQVAAQRAIKGAV